MPKTTYMWDELSDNVAAEYEDGILSASYTHEPGLYGNLLSQHRNGVTSYYHYDGRGDTVALTDDSGDVTDTKEYDAWGNVIVSTGSTVTPYLFVGRHGFQFATELGIVSFDGRPYQAEISRWLNAGYFLDLSHSNNYPFRIQEFWTDQKQFANQQYGLIEANLERTKNGKMISSAALDSDMPEISDKCKVSLCCRRLDNEMDPTGVGRHCLILITKPNGDRTTYGGHAQSANSSGCGQVLRVCSRPYPEAGFGSEPSLGECDTVGHMPCQTTFDCLDGVRKWFFHKCCCYAAVFGAEPNSNTAASTMMARCILGQGQGGKTKRPGRGWAPKYYPLPENHECRQPKPGCCPEPFAGCGDD